MTNEQLSFEILIATRCTQADIDHRAEVRKQRLEVIKQRHKALHKGKR